MIGPIMDGILSQVSRDLKIKEPLKRAQYDKGNIVVIKNQCEFYIKKTKNGLGISYVLNLSLNL